MIYEDCEKRKHRIIASFVTNSNDPDRRTWDLTPYQSAGLGTPGGTWRLVEAGAGLVYASGKVAPDGTLVSNDYIVPSEVGSGGGGIQGADGNAQQTPTPSGVPDVFSSTQSYDGYMELEVEEPDQSCPCPGLGLEE